ncbi:metallothionein [Pseudomonas capeferrum]|uniref:metallothionein n=1 Tax=Pseudomonas capeferrum TaxID=1495066 RepID=UPI0015E48DAE|nr:metallothionein [Pseudomonas capeferrum]MBA1204141.1 metallothionein [Pseudomonas capeferrum]
MNEQRCACSQCSCTVDANAKAQDGNAYCCKACANGHRNGEHCRMPDCDCGSTGQPHDDESNRAI